MKKLNSILISGEQIKERIMGTFEVHGKMGIEYKFGEIFATDKRLIWYISYPFRLEDFEIYSYNDIENVNIQHASFTFNNNISINVKWVNYGDAEQFLKKICDLVTQTKSKKQVHCAHDNQTWEKFLLICY
ncbi:PH domain-containing protein [Lentibacillus sp. L22]|uniref:PH domain-containing protein n=1 Tax=Lentibacillus TaxID=175304 RepID=UPI0022B10FD6|nr:PH domain-containing protein [Lentibacillus daqui]